jgi:hypothetical protein
MRITNHFGLEEFACRDGTPYPVEWIEGRLRPLCALLEVLRRELGGHAVAILSGYRTPFYNHFIGGAPASQHLEGRAADIVVSGVSPAAVHDTALQLHAAGELHLGGLGSYPNFTHVDVRPRPLSAGPALWSGGKQTWV